MTSDEQKEAYAAVGAAACDAVEAYRLLGIALRGLASSFAKASAALASPQSPSKAFIKAGENGLATQHIKPPTQGIAGKVSLAHGPVTNETQRIAGTAQRIVEMWGEGLY